MSVYYPILFKGERKLTSQRRLHICYNGCVSLEALPLTGPHQVILDSDDFFGSDLSVSLLDYFKRASANYYPLAYHCSLALMSILNSFVFGREPVSWEATYHLGQAVALVNEKLDTLDALSNSNLAVVNFLVIRDIFKEDEAGAKIHLRGLQKMLELRGGLCTVEDRTLALKIAK